MRGEREGGREPKPISEAQAVIFGSPPPLEIGRRDSK